MRSSLFYSKAYLILLLVWAKPLSYNVAPYYVLWDVGQGQWLSKIDSFSCLHIDLGGEFYPQKVEEDCHWQRHKHWVSHWDYDHYSFLKKMQWSYQSTEADLSAWQIYSGDSNSKNKNGQSRVLKIGSLLVSGDSLKKQEAIWLNYLQQDTEIFILGHHGSNTSNSAKLLQDLHLRLRQCIYSARKAKYNHPHMQVVQRLKKYKCPLVGTNDWGNIRFRPSKIPLAMQ